MSVWDEEEVVATTTDIGNKIICSASSFYDIPNVNLTSSLTPACEEGVVDVFMARNAYFCQYTVASVIYS